jgi:hypothetical protein
MKYLAIVVMSILFTGGIVYADGFAQTLDKSVGNYIANVDYDSLSGEIFAGNSTSFSFQLWNKSRTKTVAFNDVSVNIFQSDNPYHTIFSGTLSASFGQTGMRFAFQNEGTYTMDIRFHDANYATIADASFPLEVAPDGNTYGISALWFLLAVALGFGAGIAIMTLLRQEKTS